MKKKILMSLILLAIIGVSAVFAQAPTLDKLRFVGTTGNTEYRVRAANNSISGAVVIPDTYEGSPVVATHQDTEMFKNITGITSLTILSNQFQINPSSFEGCAGLTSVSLPQNVIVSNYAFRDCTNLTSVTFREGTRINSAFPRAFPGDLVAKFNARNGGGPGVYTRTAGSETWTRTGDAPAPIVTVNTSLNGVWEISGGGLQITVSDNSGVFSSITSANALWTDAINKGYVKVGNQYWRNLRSTGNLTWSGQALIITYNTSNRNVATGTNWRDCTITMSSDGRTISIAGSDSSGSQANTYTRK